jgi:hypothetical protein
VAGMRACPRGICRSDPLRGYSRNHALNVTDLQFVCHWIVTLGIIRAVLRAVQNLFEIEGTDEVTTTPNSLSVEGRMVVRT